MDKPKNIYFNPKECQAICMGLARMKEDLKDLRKPGNEHPWSPETIKMMNEMEEHITSSINKLEKFAGIKVKDLPPYYLGEENDFFTKPS